MRDSLCRVLAFVAILAPAAVASADPLPVVNTGSAWLGLSWRDRGPIVMTGTASPQAIEGFAREVARSGRDVVIASSEPRDQTAGGGLCKIHRAAAVIIVRDLTEGAVVGDLFACADPVATAPRQTLHWQPRAPLTPRAKLAQKGTVTGLGVLVVGLVWSFGVGIHNFGCGSDLLGGSGRGCERKSQLGPRITMGVGAGLALTSLIVLHDENANRRLHLMPAAAPGAGGMALAGRF